MFELVLQNIKNRLILKLYARDMDDYPWLAKMIQNWEAKPKSRIAPEYITDTEDFIQRYDNTLSTYNRLKSISDVGEMLQQLRGLRLFLEVAALRDKSFCKFHTMPDGRRSLYQVCRNTGIDRYFEERVLPNVRQSIIDLEELQKLIPNTTTDNSDEIFTLQIVKSNDKIVSNGPRVELTAKAKNSPKYGSDIKTIPISKNEYEKLIADKLPNSSSTTLTLSFDDFIREGIREKLMPILKRLYKEARPKNFAYMLFALDTLGYLPKSVLTANKTELFKALKFTFGSVGTRQRLSDNITDLSQAKEREELHIRQHINQIKEALN